MFEQRVLPVTEEIMFKWRLLVEDGRKAGYTFSQPDLIIAAAALHHGLTVVTRNVRDYEQVRARVFNPWVDSLPAALREGAVRSLIPTSLVCSPQWRPTFGAASVRTNQSAPRWACCACGCQLFCGVRLTRAISLCAGLQPYRKHRHLCGVHCF